MIIEEKEKTDKWVVGFYVFLILGVFGIIFWGIIAVATAGSEKERSNKVGIECVKAYPELKGNVKGITNFGDLLYLSFRDDGTIKGRILEGD